MPPLVTTRRPYRNYCINICLVLLFSITTLRKSVQTNLPSLVTRATRENILVILERVSCREYVAWIKLLNKECSVLVATVLALAFAS